MPRDGMIGFPCPWFAECSKPPMKQLTTCAADVNTRSLPSCRGVIYCLGSCFLCTQLLEKPNKQLSTISQGLQLWVSLASKHKPTSKKSFLSCSLFYVCPVELVGLGGQQQGDSDAAPKRFCQNKNTNYAGRDASVCMRPVVCFVFAACRRNRALHPVSRHTEKGLNGLIDDRFSGKPTGSCCLHKECFKDTSLSSLHENYWIQETCRMQVCDFKF